jgi:hypothetical protein
LIRGAFQIEPRKLTIKKWSQLYQEAMYLKTLDAEIQTNILSKIFGGKKEDSEESEE